MREHERIAAFFAPLAAHEPGSFSLTDDAAVLEAPAKRRLVITTDSVIQGTHVLPRATAAQLARKLVRRNLSDLAAMGASPWRYSVNLHTPETLADAWFAEFAATLQAEQEAFGMALVGGDSTSGKKPIHATMTCFGLLDQSPVLRSTAQAGDVLYASGTIGDAALGLALLTHQTSAAREQLEFLAARYHAPTPRIALGRALAGIATAMIDISDGLLADAKKLADASRVHLMIEREAVPLSPAVRQLLSLHPDHWSRILTGGDDYELLFTAPWKSMETVEALATKLETPITRIGSVSQGTGITLRDARGETLPIGTMGYEHS